jgi:hypothetical protein
MMSIKKEANKIASFCGIKVESRDTFIRCRVIILLYL